MYHWFIGISLHFMYKNMSSFCDVFYFICQTHPPKLEGGSEHLIGCPAHQVTEYWFQIMDWCRATEHIQTLQGQKYLWPTPKKCEMNAFFFFFLKMTTTSSTCLCLERLQTKAVDQIRFAPPSYFDGQVCQKKNSWSATTQENGIIKYILK